MVSQTTPRVDHTSPVQQSRGRGLLTDAKIQERWQIKRIEEKQEWKAGYSTFQSKKRCSGAADTYLAKNCGTTATIMTDDCNNNDNQNLRL